VAGRIGDMGVYKSSNTIPGTSDWLQPSSNLIRGKDDNPLADLDAKTSWIGHHSQSEPGLVHPFTTSVVKMRDNGMIDIFVSTNQGIRVDPNTRSITIMVDNTKIRTHDYRAWVENHSITNVRKNFEANADVNINLNAKKDINMKANGKWNVNIVGDVNIHTDSNLNVSANGKMTFKAGGDIDFSGSRYIWR
jgi:hypothetical protein